MKKTRTSNNSTKVVIALIVVLLLNCLIPKVSHGIDIIESMKSGLASLVYDAEFGILKLLNNIFCSDENQVKNVEIDTIRLTPENIIKGKFTIFNANIFNESTSGDVYDGVKGSFDTVEGKNSLRDTIAGWYYALRNLALIALLSILVYIAIRMMLSSIAKDKQKYKSMLKDWFVAMCLVVVMHYIMIFALNLTNEITIAIDDSGLNVDMITREQDTLRESFYNADYGDFFAHSILVFAIIGFTVVFAVKYLKRMITITFLVLLAPVTCITYPIDKVKDGKAQAFDFWLREFIYEVMIQPFHLLLYVVLIGSASSLAEQNIIYSILCFAIMIPAEKIVKEMFGIKEQLGSPLGAALGGAAMNQVMNSLKSLGSKKTGSGDDSKKENENDDSGNSAPKTKPDIGSYNNGIDSGHDDDKSDEENENTEDVRTSGGSDTSENPRQLGSETQENEDNEYYDNNNEDDYDIDSSNYENDSYTGEHENNDENNVEDNENGEDFGNESYDYNDRYSDIDEENLPKPEYQADDTNYNSDNNKEENDKPKSKMRQIYDSMKPTMSNARSAMANKFNNKLIDKYGTSSIPKVAKKMAIKGVKKGAGKAFKLATKGMLGLGLGAASAAATLWTGDPKKIAAAFGAGFSGGSNLGGKFADKTIKRADTVGDYLKTGYNEAKSDKKKIKDDKSKYFADKSERKKAIDYYKENNNNKMPSTKQINQEMEKRWKYKKMGMNDSDMIDNAVKLEEKRNNELDNLYAGAATVEQKLENDKYKNNYDTLMQTGDEEGFDAIYGKGSAEQAFKYKEYQDLKEVENNLNNKEGYRADYDRLKAGDESMKKEDFDAKYGSGAADKARAYDRNEHKSSIGSFDSYRQSVTEKQKANRAQQLSYAGKIGKEHNRNDFLDEKKMLGERSNIAAKYQEQTNCSDSEANRVATEILRDAAAIRGIDKPNIPDIKKNNTKTQEGQNEARPRKEPATDLELVRHVEEQKRDRQYKDHYDALMRKDIKAKEFDQIYGKGEAKKARDYQKLQDEFNQMEESRKRVEENQNKSAYQEEYKKYDQKKETALTEKEKRDYDRYKKYKESGKPRTLEAYAKDRTKRRIDQYYGNIRTVDGKLDSTRETYDENYAKDYESLQQGKYDKKVFDAKYKDLGGVQGAKNHSDMRKAYEKDVRRNPETAAISFDEHITKRKGNAYRKQQIENLNSEEPINI